MENHTASHPLCFCISKYSRVATLVLLRRNITVCINEENKLTWLRCLWITACPFPFSFLPEMTDDVDLALTDYLWQKLLNKWLGSYWSILSYHLCSFQTQPWCNPLWLTGLKAPTNKQTNSFQTWPSGICLALSFLALPCLAFLSCSAMPWLVLPYLALAWLVLSKPCLALPCLVLPSLAVPCFVLPFFFPCLVFSCLALSCLTLSFLPYFCLALSFPVLSCLLLPCLALFCPALY